MNTAVGQRRWVALSGWISWLALCTVVLERAGRSLPTPPATDISYALRWLMTESPTITVFTLIRYLGMALCAYLIVMTLANVLSVATKIPGLIRTVDLLTVPSLARFIRGSIGIGLAASTAISSSAISSYVFSPSIAVAQETTPATQVATMSAIDSPATSVDRSAGNVATMEVVTDSNIQANNGAQDPETRNTSGAAVMMVIPDQPTTSTPSSSITSLGTTASVSTSSSMPPSSNASTTTASTTSSPASPKPSTSPSPDTHSQPGSPSGSDGISRYPADQTGTEMASAEPSEAAGIDDLMTPRTWTIAPGDHLWLVSATTLAETLGHKPSETETLHYLYKLIELNRHVLAAPDHPDLVYVGQVFTLPTPPG